MAAIQSVAIAGYEQRTDPKAHTVYRIEVSASVRKWSMWRRYSEFDDLHSDLTAAIGESPPAILPPKHKFAVFLSSSDPAVLEERKVGLEIYLRAIVSSKDQRWREHHLFKEFLGVPVGRNAAVSPTQFTLSSWLDEHADIQSRLRDVRADINKREALSAQGDVTASHKSNVAAKQKLAGVLSRIGNLGKGLQELAMNGLSEGELHRRTDMVGRLQDECEKLGKMATIASHSSRVGQVTGGSASANPASASDREALMGPAEGRSGFARVTRVFGAPAKPQETEATRPLDDQGLLGMQQLQMDQQNEQLTQLTTILRRQRYMGEAIGQEISEQIDMLDGLSNDVDRVGNKMTATQREMKRIGS